MPIPGWIRSGSPTLGVVNHGPPPSGLVPMLAIIRRWCQIRVLTADVVGPIDAVVACHPGVVGRRTCPLAVWVDAVGDLERLEVAEAAVVLSGSDAVIEQSGKRGLFVPSDREQAAVASAVPVAPFVRGRLRRARGVADPLIVEQDPKSGQWSANGVHVPSDLVTTAVACASAAVVTGPALVVAMAWATPCITDTESQVVTGARAGRDVLVGDTLAERRRLARTVAADDRTASRLSWSGRTLVEARHRPEMAAATLVRRLRLGAASLVPGPAPLAARLAEMGTPEDSVLAQRVRMATAGFVGAKD